MAVQNRSALNRIKIDKHWKVIIRSGLFFSKRLIHRKPSLRNLAKSILKSRFVTDYILEEKFF